MYVLYCSSVQVQVQVQVRYLEITVAYPILGLAFVPGCRDPFPASMMGLGNTGHALAISGLFVGLDVSVEKKKRKMEENPEECL